MGGRSGGNSYYANLDRLYGMQADQAQQLMGLSNELVFPQFRRLVGEANDYGSQANRERAAATAGADAAASLGLSNQMMMDQMSSMGVNPADMTMALRRNSIAGAAADAAGRTGARDNVDKMGFARMMDATGMVAGTPTQATAAANAAGSTASAMGNLSMQNQANNNAALGNAVRGGINLYGFGQGQGWFADGGLVEPQRYEKGGYVIRRAQGGIIGAMKNVAAPPPPPSAPPGASAGAQVAGAAAPALMKPGIAGSMVETAGNVAGSPYVAAMGKGIANPGAVGPGIEAYTTAANQVNAALGGLEASGAAAAGAEAAGIAAAGTEAAGLGAAASGLGMGATLGAAMPYVGAAMMLGSALGLFADGGEVTPGSNGAQGGKVDGPGGPKDDMVPALLSDGEFVLPVGTVKKYGLAKLEKMRQEGLDFEKQLGIGRN